MKLETKKPYQIRSTEEERKKIKELLHKKTPYGLTYMKFLIKILEEVKKWSTIKYT